MSEIEKDQELEEIVKDAGEYPDRAKIREEILNNPPQGFVYAGPMQPPPAMVTYAGPMMNNGNMGMMFQMMSQPVQQPEPVKPDDKDSVFCTMCGSRNPRTSKFCSECGRQLEIPTSGNEEKA